MFLNPNFSILNPAPGAMDLKPFYELRGRWKGTYSLWLNPYEEVRLSDTVIDIDTITPKNFLHMRYTWLYEEKKQEGLLIINFDENKKKIIASWIDTWHNDKGIMNCEGAISLPNQMWFKGSYLVPEGPNWEWKTKIEILSESKFLLKMYNILPIGQEHLAVQVEYAKL